MPNVRCVKHLFTQCPTSYLFQRRALVAEVIVWAHTAWITTWSRTHSNVGLLRQLLEAWRTWNRDFSFVDVYCGSSVLLMVVSHAFRKALSILTKPKHTIRCSESPVNYCIADSPHVWLSHRAINNAWQLSCNPMNHKRIPDFLSEIQIDTFNDKKAITQQDPS